jgi:hypothetical protein
LAKAGEQEAQQEVADAYGSLAALSGEAAELGQRLHKQRYPALAAAVTLAAAVARQQVELAAGLPWYPKRIERAVNGCLGLSSMAAEPAAAMLAQELKILAIAILAAADTLPETLNPAVCRCAASLVQVAAQIDETLLQLTK